MLPSRQTFARWALLPWAVFVIAIMGLAYSPWSVRPADAQEVRAVLVNVEDVPVTSAAPVLTSTLIPALRTGRGGRFEVFVTAHGTGSVLSYSVIDLDNGAEIGGAPRKLNEGTALTADCEYGFGIRVAPGQGLNIEFATTTRASILLAEVR